MWTITATMTGALVGWAIIRNLANLGYRRDDETTLPAPRATWWPIPTVAAAWGLLTWRHLADPWPTLAIWLPLTPALVWLSAVDLDVRRLANTVVYPAAGWVAAILTGEAIQSGDPLPSLLAGGISLGVGLGAWLLHHFSHGSFGFGDVKLVAILSAGLATINPQMVIPALLSACALAIAAALLRRQRETPFSPWLAAGFTAALLAPLGVG